MTAGFPQKVFGAPSGAQASTRIPTVDEHQDTDQRVAGVPPKDPALAGRPSAYPMAVRVIAWNFAAEGITARVAEMGASLGERWETGIVVRGSAWKCDNSLRSRYARLVMSQEPDLENFFHVRELRAA